ncbi:MAG: hypothetical protein AB1489_14820 [Acidobacteriota bacterium]
MDEIIIRTMSKLLELTYSGKLRWHSSIFWSKGYTAVYKNVVLRLQPERLELSSADGDIARFEVATCGNSITPYLADLQAAARKAVNNYLSMQVKGVDNMMADICQIILED